ncbi:hypothetical protein AK812_SmicGene22660 [Symbiodinium microadriaticum]|uniref:Uncharacterized protein n=1 Tax=Symbiodinium microadriaticum TaxID=2951 RepID=A0A1Q9DJA8_SYMMI|nr:hypothetical protein AK812_SmicGene22660 [Symbiodinium microadriaticum]
MQSNEEGHNFWMLTSQVCFYAAYGTTGLAAVWFAAVNFVGDEAYHPLDFFSNKMRTRPYWYLAVVAATGGLLGLDMASGYLEELSNALPELVVCTNLQGFVLVGTMMFSESAGAAMVTMLAHMIVTKGFVVVITIPTAPFMPGAVYSNAYFMMYIFFVFFLKARGTKNQNAQDSGILDLGSCCVYEYESHDEISFTTLPPPSRTGSCCFGALFGDDNHLLSISEACEAHSPFKPVVKLRDFFSIFLDIANGLGLMDLDCDLIRKIYNSDPPQDGKYTCQRLLCTEGSREDEKEPKMNMGDKIGWEAFNESCGHSPVRHLPMLKDWLKPTNRKFYSLYKKVGAERHARHLVKIQFQSKFALPDGAERVPKLWARTVLRGCPVLLLVTDILFLAVYLMSRGEYGKTITILYFITALGMLLGCCSQYKSGTTVE